MALRSVPRRWAPPGGCSGPAAVISFGPLDVISGAMQGEQHDDGEQRQPDAEHPRCGPLVVPVGLDDDGGLGLGALGCEHAHVNRIRGSSTAWTMSATAKASM